MKDLYIDRFLTTQYNIGVSYDINYAIAATTWEEMTPETQAHIINISASDSRRAQHCGGLVKTYITNLLGSKEMKQYFIQAIDDILEIKYKQ